MTTLEQARKDKKFLEEQIQNLVVAFGVKYPDLKIDHATILPKYHEGYQKMSLVNVEVNVNVLI